MANLGRVDEILQKKDLTRELILDNRKPGYKGGIVFLGGSLFEGIGNENSDIDIFIIERVKDNKFQDMFNVLVQGQRLDYEIYDIEKIKTYSRILNNLDFSAPNYNPLKVINDAVVFMTFAHRLRYGEPINKFEAFYELRSHFNYEKYCRWSVDKGLFWIDNHFDDIPGMISNGELYTALYRLGELFGWATDVFIFYHQETIDRAKWRIKKVRQLLDKSPDQSYTKKFYDMMLKLFFPQFNSEQDIQDILEEGIAFLDSFIRNARNRTL